MTDEGWNEGQAGWQAAGRARAAGSACGPEAAEQFISEGILHGTPIATAEGWRGVETIAPGDLVLTFDDGLCEVQATFASRATAPAAAWPGAHWPLLVPPGVLGNHDGLRLLPGQLTLLECDLADTMFGDPFALVPARALQGWCGVAVQRPEESERAVTLVFAREQVVYARASALIHCPGLADVSPDPGQFLADQAAQARYAPLSLAAARQLLACLIAEDVGAALTRPAPEGDGQAAFAPASNRP